MSVPFPYFPPSTPEAGWAVNNKGKARCGGLHPATMGTLANKEKTGPQGGTTGGLVMTRKDHRRTKPALPNRRPHRLRPATAGLHPRAAHTAPGVVKQSRE